jgi:phenylacetate-CoA ligase
MEPRNALHWKIPSAMPGVVWPAIPAVESSAALGLLFQFERSQWESAERLASRQLNQLDLLLKHANATVPHYRSRWAGNFDPQEPLTIERFFVLPLLKRRELQERFDALKSVASPAAHGTTHETRSSGSTGTPVSVVKTQLAQLFWRAFALRDHIWHEHDLGAKLAAIRHGIPEGEFSGWGPVTDGLAATGPAAALGVQGDTESQLQWLVRQQPDYLMTYPSIARELAKLSIERGTRLPGLRQVRTFGELLGPEVRELCREAWAVPVVDVYSADEVGYIALQCPHHEHYHVQSEGVLVEILDDSGRPCAPGEIGRVVVTALHNFAMPLIRYELGDYAEAGPPCPCGRGLPVLRRILGRVRNMIVTAEGKRYWPTFGVRGLSERIPLRQAQFVQKEFDSIEARLVTGARLTPEQENTVRSTVLARLPAGFRLTLSYRDSIARSAAGKFEDFVCEVKTR